MSLTKITASLIYVFAFLCAGNMAQVQPSIITGQGNNVLDSSSTRRTAVGLINVEYMRGNQIYRNGWYNIQFDRFQSPKDDGSPLRILSLDNSGWLKVSAANSLDARYALNTTFMDSLDAVKGRMLTFEDTVSNGPIMTESAALAAVSEIDEKVDSVGALFSNYYLASNPNGFITSSALSPYLLTATAASTYYPLSGNPSGFLTSVPAQSFSSLTGKPTTLSGYGITDATPSTRTLTINGIGQDLSTNRTWTITTITGNSGTATALQTPRTINGQSFDGTANVTIPGSAVTSIPNASLTNSSITINGNSVSLGGSTTVTASPTVGAPSSGTAITVGTPFQPRAGGPCMIGINGSLTGVLGLNETVTVAMSATSGGTYTTVATDVLLIGVLGLTLDRNVCNIPVPAGWYVRVTRTGSAATFTYTKWDL